MAPSPLPDAVWEQMHVPRMARDLAVLFCPSYTAPLRSPCPIVVATLDMLQATRPSDFPRVARLVRGPLYRLSARRATQVITLAEATVTDIVRLYGVEPSRVHAIPLAADARFTNAPGRSDDDVIRRYGLGDAPYVLFVGKLAPRRRIPELIAGFLRSVADQGFPHRLVFAGPDPEGLAAGTPGRVRTWVTCRTSICQCFIGVPSSSPISPKTRASVFPIVEAMCSGTPVLTLDRPVIREVAENNAYYLESATAGHIASALTTLLNDPMKRRRLAAGGSSADCCLTGPARHDGRSTSCPRGHGRPLVIMGTSTTRVALVGLGNAGTTLHLPALAGLASARGRQRLRSRSGARERAARRSRCQSATRSNVCSTPHRTSSLWRHRPRRMRTTPFAPWRVVRMSSARSRSSRHSTRRMSIIAAAAARGRQVAVNHEFRHMPIFRSVIDGVAADGGLRYRAGVADDGSATVGGAGLARRDAAADAVRGRRAPRRPRQRDVPGAPGRRLGRDVVVRGE